MTAFNHKTTIILAGWKLVMAGLCALFIMTTAALAQDPTYLAEYKLYAQATQSGDTAAAEAHARAAWQAAEQELGDHQTTGVLAFNYGQLIIFSDASAALPALKRAQALQASGITDLPIADLNMLIAFAEFDISEQQKKEAQNLRLALEAYDATGKPSAYSAIIWLQLAAADLASERYEEAVASAASAENAIDHAMPNNYRNKAQAILITGIALLSPVPRDIIDIQAAHNGFSRARNLFPPQKDLDSFDSLLAQIIAWNAAAGAVLRSEGATDYPDHVGATEEQLAVPPLFIGEQKSAEECGIEWNRKPPIYPPNALYPGYLGAVVIGYNIRDDLKPHDIRILAEVPSDVFGKTSLRAVEKFRLKSLVVDDPACRDNRITQFIYVLEN